MNANTTTAAIRDRITRAVRALRAACAAPEQPPRPPPLVDLNPAPAKRLPDDPPVFVGGTMTGSYVVIDFGPRA